MPLPSLLIPVFALLIGLPAIALVATSGTGNRKKIILSLAAIAVIVITSLGFSIRPRTLEVKLKWWGEQPRDTSHHVAVWVTNGKKQTRCDFGERTWDPQERAYVTSASCKATGINIHDAVDITIADQDADNVNKPYDPPSVIARIDGEPAKATNDGRWANVFATSLF